MMVDSFGRRRKRHGLLLTLLLLVCGTLWIFRQSWSPVVLDAFLPVFQRLDTWAAALPWNRSEQDPLQEPGALPLDLETLMLENQVLQKKLAALQTVASENQDLRTLLSLEMPQGYQKLAARVILRSPHQWFETLLIDKGFEAGVTVNMVVMNENGVIGKTVNVTAQTSRVQLLSHPDSSVSCIVGEQKVPGVLTGQYREEMAQLQYLQNYAQIKPGAAVLTSGLGGVYPPNLTLGEVRYVHKKSTQPVPDTTVALTPLERHLEHVVVLVPEN